MRSRVGRLLLLGQGEDGGYVEMGEVIADALFVVCMLSLLPSDPCRTFSPPLHDPLAHHYQRILPPISNSKRK